VKKAQEYVNPPSTDSEQESPEPSPPPPPLKEEEKLLGKKFIEAKGKDFIRPKPIEEKPAPPKKKKRRLSKEPRPEKLDYYLTPDKVKGNKPLEDDYNAREYYGAIPIDGELYGKKLNSAGKKFVINYIHDKFEKALEEHQAFDPERNDIDFR
jgi:hypothetical protein